MCDFYLFISVSLPSYKKGLPQKIEEPSRKVGIYLVTYRVRTFDSVVIYKISNDFDKSADIALVSALTATYRRGSGRQIDNV